MKHREQLGRLSMPLVDEFDEMESLVSTWLRMEHHDDGRHKAISVDALTLGGASVIAPSAILTPDVVTSNKNNYAPGIAGKRVVRSATNASRNFTGLEEGTAGQVLDWWNVGAQDEVFIHASSSSDAPKRFLCPGSVDFTLNANDGMTLWRDGTSNRWRIRER